MGRMIVTIGFMCVFALCRTCGFERDKVTPKATGLAARPLMSELERDFREGFAPRNGGVESGGDLTSGPAMDRVDGLQGQHLAVREVEVMTVWAIPFGRTRRW